MNFPCNTGARPPVVFLFFLIASHFSPMSVVGIIYQIVFKVICLMGKKKIVLHLM
jgi:hypothetical protein